VRNMRLISGRLRFLVAAAAVAVTILGVGGVIAIRHEWRAPLCRGVAAPISVDRAREALSRAGFETRAVDRSPYCGDSAVAVLSSDGGRAAIRLTCALEESPVFHPTSVSELPPTSDGALHLVVRNVECFLYSPLARIETLRAAMRSTCLPRTSPTCSGALPTM
jgi:hypothetical protein